MLLLGTTDKTPQLLQIAREPFLLLDDGPIAVAFAKKFPHAATFNLRNHSFAPRRDYRSVCDFAELVFPDKDLMTYRNGKRALKKLMFDNTTPLAELDGDHKNPAIAEALATRDDLLLSPTLNRVLTRPPNFDFDRSVIVTLDRAVLTDDEARILGSLLIAKHKGHIILPDGGFYLRPTHITLVRQKRLTAGLHFLSELPLPLQNALLTIPEKYGAGCVYEDAVELARFSGFRPGQEGHTTFIEDRMKLGYAS